MKYFNYWLYFEIESENKFCYWENNERDWKFKQHLNNFEILLIAVTVLAF